VKKNHFVISILLKKNVLKNRSAWSTYI